MMLREATVADIPALHAIRMSVKENVLNTPGLVTEQHYTDHLTWKGKGWVCVKDGAIVGFAIVDSEQAEVWALFVDPDHERLGAGRLLHDELVRWHFQHADALHLSTAKKTRAERFYRAAGWQETGTTTHDELKFSLYRNTHA